MFEDRTYEALLEETLAVGTARGVDTREGSIFYDAVSAFLLKAAKLYTDADLVFNLVFLDTAKGPYLNKRGGEHGIERNLATYSVYEAVFEGATPVPGERFFADGFFFTLIQDGDALQFKAEDAGSATRYIASGTPAISVRNIEGLTAATFGDIVFSGSDDEEDEDYHERINDKIWGPAENGNRAHYKKWCEEVDGVGRARILPLWNGPNTVKGILMDTDGLPAPSGLVEAVQAHVDPGEEGLGEGEANLGAHFTAAAAEALTVNLSFTATLAPGKTQEDAASDSEAALTAMLKTIALKTPESEDMVIRIATVGAMILNLPSVIDYADLQLNSGTANILVAGTQVAVLGEVTVNVAV